MLTNKGLVEHAKMALAEKWGYCLGTYGQVLTNNVLDAKCSQGYGVGEYNTYWKSYLLGFLNKRVSDCYGLVKSYCWWNDANLGYGINGCPDRNQETAYKAAKIKGTIKNMPEVPGLILYMEGHAGIYIGNGKFIECKGCPYGVIEGKIQNGTVASGSNFTHWFKDTYIFYLDKAAAYIQTQTGIDNNTMKFLSFYKYDESLIEKLSIAIYEKKYREKYKGTIITEDIAIKIIKESITLEDKTIQYLQEDYKYGNSLIIKLAKAMI